MSTLDKAFIKAYTKDDQAPGGGRDETGAELVAGGFVSTVGNPADQFSTGADATEAQHRVDESHRGAVDQLSLPHVQFPGLADFGDCAYVSPYYSPQPPIVPVQAPIPAPVPPSTPAPVVNPPSEPIEAPQPTAAAAPVPSQVPPVAAVAETETTTERVVDATLPQAAVEPVNEEVNEMLQTAATIKVPSVLELPSVFETPASEEDTHALEAKEFSPDWEVDHFAWPEICGQLLETESRYFEHVGQKLKAATEENRHVLMVAGSRRGEGRTTLALCLARCAAQAGVKVALLDADLKNPQLGTQLGMETPCGWWQVIDGKAPLNEAAVASVEDRLTLFPLTESDAAVAEPADPRLGGLLREISSHYPLVIVDIGPLGAEDCHPFADDQPSTVDAAIVVRDLRNTTEKKAGATAQQLLDSGVPAVGIAENFKPAQ